MDFQWVFENREQLVRLAFEIIGVFALIASLTPTKTDDTIAGKLTRIIDVLGLNVGEAQNKEKKK